MLSYIEKHKNRRIFFFDDDFVLFSSQISHFWLWLSFYCFFSEFCYNDNVLLLYVHLHVSIFERWKRFARSKADFKIINSALRLAALPLQKCLDELKAEKI